MFGSFFAGKSIPSVEELIRIRQERAGKEAGNAESK
jgi:hypothetical protein